MSDLVEREAAIEAVSEGCQEWRGIYGRCEELINALPPVTQKSETVTEFADRCRECGAKYGKLLEQKSGNWDRLYSWLNDMRLGIAPDETVYDIDERHCREAQTDILDEIMEWMIKAEGEVRNEMSVSDKSNS